jgi:hypothetical protein
MNTNNVGARKRRTLSLRFGREKRDTGTLQHVNAPATISSDELRRLVAAMID